jgi:hypothetical protein
MALQTELHELLPLGWQVYPGVGSLKLIAPCFDDALDLAEGAKLCLQETANRLGIDLCICSTDRATPIRRIKASHNEQEDPQELPPTLSSYAPSSIASDASYETVLDFVKGKKAQGLIVTITAMGTDKCLLVNDLQALDRGGNWTAQDWIGIDFKTLWRDSFQIGQHNYYGELVQRVEAERQLAEFLYRIRRPSGALAEYSSNYFYIENFLQRPARIAVSRPGDWRIVEDGHLEPNASQA